MNIAIVPPDQVAAIWPHVGEMVEAALRRGFGGYRSADVVEALEAGQWQMWIATTPGQVVSMCCTGVADFPAKRVLYVHLAAGVRDAVSVFWPVIQGAAKAQGCSAVQFFGRPGWARSGVLPDGARRVHDVVTVELEP